MQLIQQTINSSFGPADLSGYLLDNYDRVDPNRQRPAIIFCPGGGFNHLSVREGEPLAVRMLAHGFQAFVLRYSLQPARFPAALCQLASAVQFVRSHAHEFHIAPDAIWVAGMSAGGHVAASLADYWDSHLLKGRDFTGHDIQPNGLLLGYPVITSGKFTHQGSIQALLGGQTADPDDLDKLSLEKHVTSQNPPAFIWTTANDQTVPVENALLFAQAMAAAHRPFKLQVFSQGRHGSSLGSLETSLPNGRYYAPEVTQWPEMFAEWSRQFGHTFLNTNFK